MIRRISSSLLRILALLALALPFVLAAACGGTPAASSEPSAAGRKVFLGTCATCHGKDARGLPKQGRDLHASPFVAEKTDEELVAFVKTGRRVSDPLNTSGVDMPPRGGDPALTDADLARVVAYLRTLD